MDIYTDNRAKTTSPFTIGLITVDKSQFKTLLVDGIPETTVTSIFLELSGKWKRSTNYLYYVRNLAEYLYETYGIVNLYEAQSIHLINFVDSLIEHGGKDGTLQGYATILDRLFNEYNVLNYPLHPSLLYGNRDIALDGLRGLARKQLTIVGYIFRRKCGKKIRTETSVTKHSSWRTPEEIDAVCSVLTLRDKCVFLLGIETGYRISSILSIRFSLEDIRRRVVAETFSKTGKLHSAKISRTLQALLLRYINAERSQVVSDVEFDCNYLFLVSKGGGKGACLSEGTYYSRLKVAQKAIRDRYPEFQKIILHSHDGRVTFFNNIMRRNRENKLAGKPYYTDTMILMQMDWRSMLNLEAYYKFEEQFNEVSMLLEEFESAD